MLDEGEKIKRREMIEAEDMSFLYPRLEKGGSSKEDLPGMIREYQRYLIMRVYHEDELPMYSNPVDDVWHAHILFTERYRTFCDRIFGRYLDHRPYSKEEFTARLNEYYEKTLILYKEIFGEEVPSLWHKI